MIEIALCLAIIGFALVAIIGVLPTGLGVQRENREETIINQEVAVWMDAIRGGARGYNDLTNYVLTISNIVTYFQVNGTNVTQVPGPPDLYIFTFGGSTKNGVATVPQIPLSYGSNIIGLLSKPKIEWTSPGTAFASNYVAAAVRALSGAAAEKLPQTNQSVLLDAFSYKLIAEIVPYVPVDPSATNYNFYALNTPEWTNAYNYARVIWTLQTNSHDIRLTFRWPYLPTGEPGNGRRSFRTMNGGAMQKFEQTDVGLNIYFFRPATYEQTVMK